jgi:hypothetical protein
MRLALALVPHLVQHIESTLGELSGGAHTGAACADDHCVVGAMARGHSLVLSWFGRP